MKNQAKALSSGAFEAAVTFLKNNSRPLELSRFENSFGCEGTENIVNELRKFQNTDGGFGHALEADLRTPDSSALCTSVAFQVIREHGISENEELVQRGLDYLLDTLNKDDLYWRIIPESADNAPHAPWWTQENRDFFSLNPTAEILGYLLDYGGSTVDERLLQNITSRMLKELHKMKEIEMHDLLCCLRLIETKNLPLSDNEIIQQELHRLIADTVATSPEQWSEYSLRPLQVVSHPNSPFIEGLEQAISLNLDYEIHEQASNGSWSPTWDWDGLHPATWKNAKREWSGWLTLEKLLLLKRFRRLSQTIYRNTHHEDDHRNRKTAYPRAGSNRH